MRTLSTSGKKGGVETRASDDRVLTILTVEDGPKDHHSIVLEAICDDKVVDWTSKCHSEAMCDADGKITSSDLSCQRACRCSNVAEPQTQDGLHPVGEVKGSDKSHSNNIGIAPPASEHKAALPTEVEDNTRPEVPEADLSLADNTEGMLGEYSTPIHDWSNLRCVASVFKAFCTVHANCDGSGRVQSQQTFPDCSKLCFCV
jgi:hypothetical protein